MPPKTESMEGVRAGQETELGEMSQARECGHVGHVTPFLLYPASYLKQGVDGIRLAHWKDHDHIVETDVLRRKRVIRWGGGGQGSSNVSGEE